MEDELFQDICKFTNKYDVYVNFNEIDDSYEIKLKLTNNSSHDVNIMPGKMHLEKSSNGNLIYKSNGKYSICFKNM